ncbi:MAG: hypothetical protein ACI31B_04015 [Muribaculaceae bacterium]
MQGSEAEYYPTEGVEIPPADPWGLTLQPMPQVPTLPQNCLTPKCE